MTEVRKLRNNIPVICEEMPEMKSVSFGIFVRMGSALEDKHNNGISHVIEHMIFKGTKNHNVRELADIMSDLGGNINAFTAKEETSFYGRVLTEDFQRAMDLMSEMLFESVFNPCDISKEKSVIIDEIDLYDDSAEDLCHELLQKKVWKNSPYGYIISGNRSNVKSFTRDELVNTWRDNYIPANMLISVAGGISADNVMRILNNTFGYIEDRGVANEYPKAVYERAFLYKYKDTEQVHLNIAFDNVPSSSAVRFPMNIINAALGGNLNARLFQRIREEMGLVYSIYSYGSTFNTAGLFHIYASMSPEHVVKVVRGIYKVISDFVSEGMDEKELEITKKQLKTEMILTGEAVTARMNSNAKSYNVLGKVENIDDTINQINKVTVEEINECLKKYLDVNNMSIALIGDVTDEDIRILKKEWRKRHE